MIGDGIGWAFAYTWELEEYILYHTVDYGRNWEQISVIPAPGNTTFIHMDFVDEQHGELVTLYMGDHIDFLTTSDGGITWTLATRYSPPFDVVTRTEVLEAYVSTRRDEGESMSTDYLSDWKVETKENSLVISRRTLQENQSWSNWEIVNSLPTHLNYQDGRIVIP